MSRVLNSCTRQRISSTRRLPCRYDTWRFSKQLRREAEARYCSCLCLANNLMDEPYNQINLMQLPLSKEEVVQKSRDYYKTLIKQAKPTSYTLNVSLTSNPFLKGKDEFKYLNAKLKEYNNRVEKGQVKDTYQMLSYQMMHSMLSDLAQIGTMEDQVTVLGEVFTWFKDQLKLIEQRCDQGEIRYEMSKQYRQALKYVPEKDEEKVEEELEIPFYLIERIIEPYRQHWRTLHKQYQSPVQRLKEYKPRNLNILNLETSEPIKEKNRLARVLYPMPPKYEEPKEEEPQVKPEADAEGVVAPIEGTNPDGPQPEEAPEQPGQDLGGLGQQPQEPDEDEPPEEVPDKLRPKNPIYVDAISADNVKKYKEGYLYYKGDDTRQQRNMDKRYLQIYHDKLRRQREDINQIDIAHEWAKRKARVAKDIQRKLEEMKFKPEFSFSNEPPVNQERIAPQDELRFGFTTAVRTRPKTNQIDFTLPDLNKTARTGLDEKSIRRDRLSSLRNKFAKVLNLVDHQQRQSAPSLCQYTSRRRGLSQIIRNHSHSRERLVQLQEVGKIKEKLTKVKVNINIRALSKGLCLPENEDYFSETTREYPTKDLPSNPDMAAEAKKKKKKKKK